MSNEIIMESNASFGEGKMGRIENMGRLVLLILTFLLPIFFIPKLAFPIPFGKLALISVGGFLAFILWIVSRLRAGSFKLPKHLVFYSAWLILLFGLVSTLFSGSIMESFIGVSGETNTFFFILALFILFFVSFNIFRSPERVLNLYFWLFISSLILIIFQILRLFLGADFLDFGIFTSPTSTPLGRWNDLGILFGLSTIISVTTLEFFKPTRLLKILLYVFTVLSLALIVVINSILIWSVLGVASLLLFVYLYFQRKKETLPDGTPNQKRWKNFSKLSITVFVLAVLFVILRPQVGTFISEKYNISQIEARPSLISTLKVAQAALTQGPGFGAGFNRFSTEWGMNKPVGVNNTIFWNTNFNYGVGIVPTFLVTNGVLGFAAWVVFLGALLLLGMRALFSSIKDPTSRFIVISSFLATLYLWVFSIISVPGAVILAVTFLMTGIFMASVVSLGFIKHKEISFSDDSRIGFVSVFSLVVVLIVSVGFIYMIVTRYTSSVYAQKSLIEINQNGSLDKGLKNINRAISLAGTDSNYRLVSQIHVARLNSLLSNQELAGTEEGLALFQEILGEAILSAQTATQIDKADYRNWITLGNIYEAIIPLGIQGAYENAKKTYETAENKNPTNPSIDLALARLEVTRGSNDTARINIQNSLQKKNNYTDAIFLLSQIEINEGNIKQAINAVEAASLLSPNDALTFFQLGFLKFNQGDFDGSVVALERAVSLNPPYSNAKYFLGLSYYNVGRPEDAVQQFVDLEDLNPDNVEVKTILKNLRNGDQPFLNLGDSDPETRGSLPVKES